MALIYKGVLPQHINDIPATDLSDAELNELIANGTASRVCGKEVSLAEFEGMLIKHGLYTSVPKTAPKATKKEEEN